MSALLCYGTRQRQGETRPMLETHWNNLGSEKYTVMPTRGRLWASLCFCAASTSLFQHTHTHTQALFSYTDESSPVRFHQSLISVCVISVHESVRSAACRCVNCMTVCMQLMCNFVISRSWVRALAIENDNKGRADVVEAEGGRDKWTRRHSGRLCIDSRGHVERLSLPVASAQGAK